MQSLSVGCSGQWLSGTDALVPPVHLARLENLGCVARCAMLCQLQAGVELEASQCLCLDSIWGVRHKSVHVSILERVGWSHVSLWQGTCDPAKPSLEQGKRLHLI